MKKAVQFGAGNIGRGFIGALLSQAGYQVTFADVAEPVIDKINADKTYTVHVMDVQCEDQTITGIRGVNSTKPEANPSDCGGGARHHGGWTGHPAAYRAGPLPPRLKNAGPTA